MHAVLRRDQPGEERRTCRRADRIARQRPREPHSLGRQAVDVRRLDVRIAVAAEGPGPLVIGQDENRSLSEKVQKLTDDTIAEMDKVLSVKEAEILQV